MIFNIQQILNYYTKQKKIQQMIVIFLKFIISTRGGYFDNSLWRQKT